MQARCHSSLLPLHTRCHCERSPPGRTESRNLPARQSTLSLHSRIGANPPVTALSHRCTPACHSALPPLHTRCHSKRSLPGLTESRNLPARQSTLSLESLSPRCKPACHCTLASVQTRCHSSLPPLHTRCHSKRSLPGLTESRNLPARQSTLSLHSLLGANPPVTHSRIGANPLHSSLPAAHSLSFQAESAGADGVEESPRPAVNPVLSLHSLPSVQTRCHSALSLGAHSLSFRAESAGADGVEESPRPAVNPVTALSHRCGALPPLHTACHYTLSSVQTRCHSALPAAAHSLSFRAESAGADGVEESPRPAVNPVTALSHRCKPAALRTPPAAHSLSFRAESAGADGVEESPRPAVNPVTALSHRCKPAATPHSPRCTLAVIPSGVCRG